MLLLTPQQRHIAAIAENSLLCTHYNTDLLTRVARFVTAGGENAEGGLIGEFVVRASVMRVDGAGRSRGNGGPAYTWDGDWENCPGISSWGFIIIDEEDVDGMEGNGSLEGTVVHEIGHALGVG